MRRAHRHLTYANVISTLCLFLILAGGVAYAADTIFSSDIVDGEVKSADIGNNQVFSADVRDETQSNGGLAAEDLGPGSVGTSEVDGSLTGADIADNALTGADIADNTLLSADINEATLSTVPNASTLDGLDSTRFKNVANSGTGQCQNLATTETTCASTTLSGLTSGDDIYLSVWWRWTGEGVGPDHAFCAIKRGAVQFEGARFGQEGNEHDINDTSALGSLVVLDTAAPAGTTSYSFVCDENDGAMNIINSRIVAIRLSG